MRLRWMSVEEDLTQQHWVFRSVYVPGGSTHDAIVPFSTLQWRSVEYGIPITDETRLLEIVLKEIEIMAVETSSMEEADRIQMEYIYPYATTADNALALKETQLQRVPTLLFGPGASLQTFADAMSDQIMPDPAEYAIKQGAARSTRASVPVERRRVLQDAIALLDVGTVGTVADALAYVRQN